MSNSQNKLGQREAEVSQCASVEPRGMDWTLLANVAHPQTFKCLTFYSLFNYSFFWVQKRHLELKGSERYCASIIGLKMHLFVGGITRPEPYT